MKTVRVFRTRLDALLSAALSAGLLAGPAATSLAQAQNEGGDQFGTAVAVGDFDGDGRPDLAIGVPGEATGRGPRSGVVRTFRNTPQGLQPWSIIDTGALGQPAAGNGFGMAMAVGDFNGDGRDDLAVGAPGAAAVASAAAAPGARGPALPVAVPAPAPAPAAPVPPPAPRPLTRGQFGLPGFDGEAFVAAGEIIPGFRPPPDPNPMPAPAAPPPPPPPPLPVAPPPPPAPIAAPAPLAPAPVQAQGPRSGVVFVYLGSPAGLTPATRLDQELGDRSGRNAAGDLFGMTLAAGDFNRDGVIDLAVGAPGDQGPGNGPRAGSVFVFRGMRTGFLPGQLLPSPTGTAAVTANDNFGMALAAGDFDGDGIIDLAVGAPGKSTREAARSGAVSVFRGSAMGLVVGQSIEQTTNGIATNETGDAFGMSLAAGDFNGDGIVDLAIGTPGEAPGEDPRAGLVLVFAGSRQGLRAAQALEQELMVRATNQVLATNAAGDQFGFALAAGDFDGDRLVDLAVGSPSKADRTGSVFIFRGGRAGLEPDSRLTQVTTGVGGEGAGDLFGFSLTAADLDRDGRAELEVGTPAKGLDGGPRAGAVFSLRGTANGLRGGGMRLDQRGIDRPGAAAPAPAPAPARR